MKTLLSRGWQQDQRRKSSNCTQTLLYWAEVLTSSSRQYLEKGPPAAEVTGVEMIQEQQGVSDDAVAKALGGSQGFQVR